MQGNQQQRLEEKIPYGLALREGEVKWFNDSKGFGFINEGDDGIDIFVHFSCIRCDGYKKLDGGQKVRFAYIDTPKGLQAVYVLPEKEHHA